MISGKYFPHPISLAKKIMTESPHCAFSGDGALKFAQEHNIPHCAPTHDDHPDWDKESGIDSLPDALGMLCDIFLTFNFSKNRQIL